jgi:hypothetical protein
MSSIWLFMWALAATPTAASRDDSAIEAAISRLEPRHAFYGIYMLGIKAGYAEEWLGPTRVDGRPVLESRQEAHVNFKRAGFTIKMEVSTRRLYDPKPPYRLVELREHVDGLGTRLTFTGAHEGGVFRLKADAGEGPRLVARAEPPRETFADVVAWLAYMDDPVGTSFPSLRYDVQMGKNVRVVNQVLTRSRVLLAGKLVDVITLESDEPDSGLTLQSRFRADGTLLEGAMGEQFRMARESEAIAKDPHVAMIDLYARSIVPATGATASLRAPGKLTRAVYRVCGVDPAHLAGPGQIVVAEEDTDCARVTVSRGQTRPVPLSAEERARSLESDERVTARDAPIRAAASKALRSRSKPDLVALTRWVHRKVAYSLDFNPWSASQVLAKGRGDCSEAALLLVALARAAGLPAREVTGLVLAEGEPAGFGYHAWAEVYVDGRWTPVDPTWDEVPINPTHIRFELDGPYGLLAIFGRIAIEVLEAG